MRDDTYIDLQAEAPTTEEPTTEMPSEDVLATEQEVTEPVPEPEVPPFKYGFAVLVNEGGEVFIEKDLSLFSIPVERPASLIEIRRYVSEILMDLQAQASAEYTAIRVQKVQQEAETPES
jgi:hypothetical protein